jgi:small redox-active disulfide protein 2
MKTIKILGTGCAKCNSTFDLFKKVIEETGSDADLQKVTDIQEIMKYLVMTTPGIVVDEKLVHSGSIPPEKQIKEWLS